jgi:hypothetical protein
MKTRKNSFIGLTVGRLPRLVVYKPPAILMAILLAPAISWMGRQRRIQERGKR